MKLRALSFLVLPLLAPTAVRAQADLREPGLTGPAEEEPPPSAEVLETPTERAVAPEKEEKKTAEPVEAPPETPPDAEGGAAEGKTAEGETAEDTAEDTAVVEGAPEQPKKSDVAAPSEAALDAEKQEREKVQLREEIQRQEGNLGTLDEPGTTTVADVDVEAELPKRLGPVNLVINDQGDRIGLGVATQLRFRYAEDLSSDVDEGSSLNLEFRRLRGVLSSSFLDGHVRSSLQFNLLPGALELIDMWVLYQTKGAIGFRAGQFKIPYTRYRAQSFASLSIDDWSPVTRIYGSERQLGIEMLNPRPELLPLEYSLGIFAGNNARGAHGVGLADYYESGSTNPSDLTGGDPVPTDIHPEVVARFARNFGKIDTSANTSTSASHGTRHSVGFSAAWDADPDERSEMAIRLAPEWLMKIGKAYLNIVGHVGWIEADESLLFAGWAGMGEAGYRFSRMWETALRFSTICYYDGLREDAQQFGEEQIGDGADPELVEQYEALGRVKRENELALSLNQYIIGHSLKGQLAGIWAFSDGEDDLQNTLGFRYQLQFQF